jgi:hypothetical protein
MEIGKEKIRIGTIYSRDGKKELIKMVKNQK